MNKRALNLEGGGGPLTYTSLDVSVASPSLRGIYQLQVISCVKKQETSTVSSYLNIGIGTIEVLLLMTTFDNSCCTLLNNRFLLLVHSLHFSIFKTRVGSCNPGCSRFSSVILLCL